jgi:histidinol-phosphatase
MYLEKELDVALKACRLAGDLALSHFDRPAVAEEKADHSPVTEADRECEFEICRFLSEHFPEDGLLAEEGTFRESRSGRRWIIDPIDGTRDFVRRAPFWAVQLALEIRDHIVLGVIHLPCFSEVVHAAAGAGCFWNGIRVRASETAQLERAVLLVSGFQSVWQVWPPEMVRHLTQTAWTVRAHGACYDIAQIARGKADIWLSGAGKPWDYAPVKVIVGEAGGFFLTRDGTGRIDAGHCLVCAPGLREELCRLLGMPA